MAKGKKKAKKKTKRAAGSNVLEILVHPEVTTYPPPNPLPSPQVHLSDRAPKHKGRKKIRWVKDPVWAAANPGVAFQFISLAPDTAPDKNPFHKIDVKKNHIECRFDPSASAGPEWPYMLVIESNGVPYDADDTQGPGDGKPVIRN